MAVYIAKPFTSIHLKKAVHQFKLYFENVLFFKESRININTQKDNSTFLHNLIEKNYNRYFWLAQ